ncbi:MAG: exopolysaccharide biosynthesis protein [Gammaproteobacteria bacterium]|nr:exopolysaccharide biosynthesis protein [Rhodoferax sp.]MBU3899823.1 exopolysaccharide biosynthesis protein [Gammaproteobacteria bacterium]MBU3998854.1 exopolysaccharide biosynthesis protein [Gammaproteobacteria bacterium]MBU4019087.1 exopolysaccharide biosynthesis protein [Gammaproteobacteria bacterium]MBU4078806.1 exopolysaccharide biosynthesis protein [Gammaproteobacteria bacterium]
MSNERGDCVDQQHKSIVTKPSGGRALSTILWELSTDTQRERIAISDLLVALGDRATGALIFIFAFPKVLPTPPGTSTILGAPLIFLAAQLMLGRAPWLPAFVANRSMTRSDFSSLVKRIVPWLQRAEGLLRPRLSSFTLPPMEYLVGLLSLLLAVLLVLPIPLGNVLPALAISLMALGVLERDGLWVIAGLTVSVAAVFVVYGVLFAMVKATWYFFTQVL